MKKIFIALAFLICCFAAQSQNHPGYVPTVKSYGNAWLRVVPDSALHLPGKPYNRLNDNDTTPQIFTRTDSPGHLILFQNGVYYNIVGGSGGGYSGSDTIYIQNEGSTGQWTGYPVNDKTIGLKNLTGPLAKYVTTNTDSSLVVNELFGYGDDSAFADRLFNLNGHPLTISGSNITAQFYPTITSFYSDDGTSNSGISIQASNLAFFSQADDESKSTNIFFSPDSISFSNTDGVYNFDNIINAPTNSYKYMVWDTATHRMEVAGLDSTGHALPTFETVLENGDTAYHEMAINNPTTNNSNIYVDPISDEVLIASYVGGIARVAVSGGITEIDAANGLYLNLSGSSVSNFLQTQAAQTLGNNVYLGNATAGGTDTIAYLRNVRALIAGGGGGSSKRFGITGEDDSLLQNRFVTGGVYNLGITSTTGSSTATIVAINLGTGAGITGNSTGGAGLNGISTNGPGTQAISTNGYGAVYDIAPSSTNTQPVILELERQSTGTPAVGIGGAIEFSLENSATLFTPANQIRSKFTNVTSGSEASALEFWGKTGGAGLAKLMSIAGTGQITGSLYGRGTFTGTAAYALSVDASGNIIETTAGGGGGGTLTAVTGTANRITSSGGTTPAIDISASYVGQTSLTTLGTITTGVWNGTALTGTYGGGNSRPSTTTSSSSTTFSLIAGDIIDFIDATPTTTATAFTVTSSDGTTLVASHALTTGLNHFSSGYEEGGSVTITVSGITSSTVITLIKRSL